MNNRVRRLRVLNLFKLKKVKPVKVEPIKSDVVEIEPELKEKLTKTKVSPKKVKKVIEEVQKTSAKIVYVYKGKKCVGEYDSITKCGAALGMTRLMVRKAIETGSELDNGLILTFTKNN